jgi:hypothetical protein
MLQLTAGAAAEVSLPLYYFLFPLLPFTPPGGGGGHIWHLPVYLSPHPAARESAWFLLSSY